MLDTEVPWGDAGGSHLAGLIPRHICVILYFWGVHASLCICVWGYPFTVTHAWSYVRYSDWRTVMLTPRDQAQSENTISRWPGG